MKQGTITLTDQERQSNVKDSPVDPKQFMNEV